MDITRPPGAAVFPAHPLDGLVNTLELAVESGNAGCVHATATVRTSRLARIETNDHLHAGG